MSKWELLLNAGKYAVIIGLLGVGTTLTIETFRHGILGGFCVMSFFFFIYGFILCIIKSEYDKKNKQVDTTGI